MITNKMRLIARSLFLTKSSSIIYRSATATDVDIMTQRAVIEGWHIGPYDFQCGFAFDPRGFFICKINGELVSHVVSVRYPNHSSFIGGNIVTKQFRGKGYSQKNALKAVNFCDKDLTIGVDANLFLKSMFEKIGFQRKWNSYSAMFCLEKIVANLANMKVPDNIAVKSVYRVRFENLLDYDCHVFGTGRKIFLERLISAPGSFGFTAVDEKSDNVAGYIIVKQVIRGGGTEIGLAVAPLYADNVHIAKILLKTSAEYCLSNRAVPNTNMGMYHPVGENCGGDAPKLMKELEAELTHIGYRMYTKEVPPGRQLKKIYGITSPTFD